MRVTFMARVTAGTGEVNARLSCSVEHAVVLCMSMRRMVCSRHTWADAHMQPYISSTQILTYTRTKHHSVRA